VKIRHQARIIALQALFEIDCANHDPQTVLGHRLEARPLPEEGAAFAHKLIWGVLNHQEDLDRVIQTHAPEWPLEQIALIDRNILRLALYEILVDQETPYKVAINEAVELAKLFGSDSSSRFVNGVLGSVVAQHAHILHQSGRRQKDKKK